MTDTGTFLQQRREGTDGRILVLTLHRPDARNALNRALIESLMDALHAADDDRSVGVIVLTGTDPAFSGGVDLKEMTGPGQRRRRLRPNPGDALRAMRVPVIAAVNGVCVTGGLELALSCDFIVASERARFADTHAQVGLMSGWGLSAILAEAVGVRRAKELSGTGRFVSADEALAIGIANHVVAHDRLLPFTFELAEMMLKAAPKALRGMFELYDHGIGQTQDSALKAEELAVSVFVQGTADVALRRDEVMERGRRTVATGDPVPPAT